MRRNDREIASRAEIKAILDEAQVCRIGLADEHGPYIVPVCFGYEDGALYIHSAPEAPENLGGPSHASSLTGSTESKIPPGSSHASSLSGSVESKNLPGSSHTSSLSGFGGKKIAMIRKNPCCCFEADICDGVIRGDRACSWGMRYRSVIGFGKAEILTDPAEKRRGLNCIMRHYGGGTHDFSEKDLASVAVIRIAVESLTGKKHG
jgi:nitroimidazol reductase NimA-like FMN-containing flavoprotein (pyridoxamine 5'-phosphate oxidase superfamily)